jgi:hypothetical protein
MEITKVQIWQDGYKVNDQFFIPIDESNLDYQDVKAYIDNGGVVDPEFTDAELLQKAKDSKITQLKINRDEDNKRPLVSQQALEIIDNGDGTFTTSANLKYFSFSVEKTGLSVTEPSNIINTALRGNVVRYSCAIIEGATQRKGYIEIDSSVAANIETHLAIRAQENIAFANRQEKVINACTTIEEVEAVDISIT